MSEMQALLQQAREMLASQGAPVTTENLNRAMLALSQNQSASADGFDMNAQVDRVMQRSTPRRANVPRNEQPNAPVGASGTAPDEGAIPDMTLPMPPPDIRDAAQSAGQRTTIIPGEGTMYTPEDAPTSSLDGNGMQNRLLRDLVMGAESAGAVTGMLPAMRGGAAATRATPTSAELSPTMQRAMAGPDLPPGLPTGLSPMQRATMMGPGEAGNAAMAAARAGAAPKPRNMSAAQRQRRQNIAESP